MKKFWKKVEIREIFKNTFQVQLDKKILKTPMKKDLRFLNYHIAFETSKEWDIDGPIINTDGMIFYGLMSTAIDKIAKNRTLFINEILSFIDTDLICYRADAPNELVQLQNKKWDPIISIIEKYTGFRLETFIGIMPSKQKKAVHLKVKQLVNKFSDLEISALHRITNVTGSIFLSLCILKGDLYKNHAFELSFLDELWQAENWGDEEEASKKRKNISLELNRFIYFVDCLRK
ncbi:hypothetical protein OAK51_04235 [Alphaproteobacteria bacterium]|nr:hypothetical protein [Alphaproteobacteria bacterium]